jgi:uncharacterized repeat protein (TIGR01451 family)
VKRLRTKRKIISNTNWLKRLAATLFIGSVMHSPMQAIAQTQNLSVPITNQASYTYTNPDTKTVFQGATSQLSVTIAPLADPLGRILGCSGELLPDYTGFSVAVYEPDPKDPTGTELGRLLPLTRTELPDIPNNGVPGGKSPNIENSNPYFLTNNNKGAYNFLFDPNKGQTDLDRIYIFVVNPPPNTVYQQRRIKIQILQSTGGINNSIIRYVATSLDGQPITARGETTTQGTVVFVANAETVGLDLLAFQFTSNLCQPHQVQIVKTGDRATAEPGDTVIYRLSVKNLADAGLNGVVATDTLPLGFNFLPKSVRGQIDGQPVVITSQHSGSTVTFQTQAVIPQQKVLNIAYAVQLTPDSVRGSGRNSVIVNARRADNGFSTKDGPATQQLRIRPGITADCGTIIGRVFVDKNFDGEQQPNEPGIPNAVIYLEDGNRITTDANGLFSVVNMPPGNHTGVLDLSSLPGYTLAPNRKFKERNSQSRLIRLEPGGMARMNFAVTPSFQENAAK